ncbi:hypothetical protein KBY75_03360 [Cyanobium sp. T1G-Tous]|uniref:cytochrome P450 n=1 Tax=Cyanobium sp. T1G-Tous TaxID=2823722 RepID=UPI0020CFA7B5|nr:cytochrome P450 [Cyanobium sp. T1G-Tous]MCP9802602.1 hypothetical protein [Cyanobium sp. T1G-Tous]
MQQPAKTRDSALVTSLSVLAQLKNEGDILRAWSRHELLQDPPAHAPISQLRAYNVIATLLRKARQHEKTEYCVPRTDIEISI